MTMRKLIVVIFLLIGVNAAHASALASQFVEQSSPYQLGPGEAANIAKDHLGGGRVLGTTRVNKHQTPAYRVKILTKSGRVRPVFVDGIDGSILLHRKKPGS